MNKQSFFFHKSKLATKFGAVVTSGALMLSTLTGSTFAAGWNHDWGNSRSNNQGGWMQNQGWWQPQQQQYHNPWQGNQWQTPQPSINTDVRVDTRIHQTTNNYFENNVNLINSASGGGWPYGEPAGGFNATVHINNTAHGNTFGFGQ